MQEGIPRSESIGIEERFERMVQWISRQKPGLSPAEAKKQTLAFMATMPAWREHPQLKAALAT